MTISQYLLSVLVLMICLSMASGRGGRGGHGRGGHHGRGGKTGKACKMFNVTLGTEVFPEKTCGCDGETTVACNLGPLTYDKRCAGKLQATFCNIEPDWTRAFPWKGILAKACLIQAVAEGGQIYKDTPCRGSDKTCDATNSLTLTVNGTDAVANFCSRPALMEDDNGRPCRPRTAPTSVETCVSLEESQRRPHSSHSEGFKFGGRKGHTGGTGHQGGGGYGKYKGGRRGGRRGGRLGN